MFLTQSKRLILATLIAGPQNVVDIQDETKLPLHQVRDELRQLRSDRLVCEILTPDRHDYALSARGLAEANQQFELELELDINNYPIGLSE